jgi:O-antigen ligase
VSSKIRQLALPAFVLLCLLVGGSVRGLWQNAALQLLAIALIVFALLGRRDEPTARGLKALVILVCLSLAMVVIQLVPLPPSLWSSLPYRETVVRSFALQGFPLPWLPISLAPYATLSSALMLLSPVAVLIATLRLPQKEAWLIGAVIIGAVLNVLLGAAQVASGATSSRWYMYEITNTGAVGFFANSNHAGILLLSALSFSIALVAIGWSKRHGRSRTPRELLLGLPALILISIGLVLNHSLAVLALSGPSVLASVLLFPACWKFRRVILPAGATAILGAFILLISSSITGTLQATDSASFRNRSEIWANTFELIGRTFPAGTGFGSFEFVYPATEDARFVDRFFVNHAHNDFLELVLEGGLTTALVLVAFCGWWAVAVSRTWLSSQSSNFAKVAAVASGAILAHSVVDYPLRTSAISVLFALCVGMLMASRFPLEGHIRNLAQARHVRIA